MSLTLFFVSYVSMKFEVVSLNRFSDSFQWVLHIPFSFMFCKIRSKLFDLYYSIVDYNKRILCTSLRQSKVSLKLIYYVLLLNTMHNRKNMQTCFKLDENGKKTKQKIHNLFGFYITRKWVLKSTTRFTLTLSALNIDPSNLYHIVWVPNRLKEC